MPYRSSQASKTITVLTVTVTFDMDKNVASQGEDVRFYGRVTSNGYPEPWISVEVYAEHPDFGKALLVSGTTDEDGYYELIWRVPWTLNDVKIPCKTLTVYAYVPDYDVSSDSKSLKIAYRTRISISAPDRVSPGKTFTVSGKLEYEDSDGWKPLAGRTVKVYYNGNLIGSDTTDSEGKYSVSGSISSPGTYTLKAVFEGEGLVLPATAVKVMGVTTQLLNPLIVSVAMIGISALIERRL